MKITVTESMFKNAFVEMGRKDNFTYAGLSALFEYLEDCEKDVGEEYELDVIALCCDFTEESYQDIGRNYDIEVSDCETEEDIFYTVLDFLENETTVIHSDEDTGMILYRNF